MTHDQAIARIQELGAQAQSQASAAAMAGEAYAAAMEGFNKAAAANDESLMEQIRLQLHASVDIICDAGAMIQRIKREQESIARQFGAK